MRARPMSLHRLARRFAVWVLAWFACGIAAATVSPLVQPRTLELVCSAGGMQLLVAGADGDLQPVGSHGADCALCLAAGAPPPLPAHAAVYPQPLAHALRPLPAARIAGLTAAPPPARGPPAPRTTA